MPSKNYSTGIKTKPFLYVELKKMAKLKQKNEELSAKGLKGEALEEDILDFDTKNRKREVASALVKRLEVLDNFLIKKLLDGDIDVSKQIALFSILKTDRLFFEFMDEVYKDKYIIGESSITEKDFNVFFRRKAEQNDRVDSWSDYTYYKLKQVFIRILNEANFINNRKECEIVKPLIPGYVVQHLKEKGDEEFLEAMLGGL